MCHCRKECHWLAALFLNHLSWFFFRMFTCWNTCTESQITNHARGNGAGFRWLLQEGSYLFVDCNDSPLKCSKHAGQNCVLHTGGMNWLRHPLIFNQTLFGGSIKSWSIAEDTDRRGYSWYRKQNLRMSFPDPTCLLDDYNLNVQCIVHWGHYCCSRTTKIQSSMRR